jgi:aminoglycoside phosphotransferase (APT) family kinase protein
MPVSDIAGTASAAPASTPDSLIAALRAAGLCGANETPRLTPLTGGVASDIFRVETAAGSVFALKRALPKLRVKSDWHAPVERNLAEVEWLRFASEIVPENVPHVVAHMPDVHMFAMDYLDPDHHPTWKSQLLAGCADVGFAASVGDRIARVHAASAGDDSVACRFANDATFHAIRLEPYLEATARQHPALSDRLMALSRATLAMRKALVHGDVSPKNILIGKAGPIFLDAECAWYGDPAFDIAFCLNHLLLKSFWAPQSAGLYLASFDALIEAYFAAAAFEDRAELEGRAARLLPALLLARIDGKSPVEYIVDERTRNAVRDFAIPLIEAPPPALSAIRQGCAAALAATKESPTP